MTRAQPPSQIATPAPSTDPARSRWAGVALMVAISLGVGPGILGLSFCQLAIGGGIERVWFDLSRDGSPERSGGSLANRQIQGALAKAVRDLLTGKSSLATPASDSRPSITLARDTRSLHVPDVALLGGRGLDVNQMPQPPPVI